MYLQNNDQSAPTPTSNQIQPNNISENDGEEVNLLWYLLVIWRKKWLILTVFFIILLGFGIKISMMPPIFESTTLIKIGEINAAKIETTGNIKAVFSEAALLKKIASDLKLSGDINLANISDKFEISEDNSNKSDLLIITGTGESPDVAVKVVETVSSILLERHNKLFESAKKIQDIEIDLLGRAREKTMQDIQLIKNEIVQHDQEIIYYQKEVDKRSKIESDGQGRITESYLNLLKNAKIDKQIKVNTIKNLEYELSNYDTTLFKKKYELNKNTYMTTVESVLIAPQFKIGPNRKKLAIQSGLIALFASLISSFVVEFVGNCGKKIAALKNNH